MHTSLLARFLAGALVSATLLACGDDDGDPPAPDAAAAPDAATGGPDAAAVGWQLLGGRVSPSGAYAEDPAMLVVAGDPAVGYRHDSFEVNLHTWDGAAWSATAADPTDANTIASIYRAPDFCAAGDAVYMAYTDAGDGAADGDAFYDRIFLYRWTRGGGWQIMNGGAEVSQPENSGAGIGYHADEVSVDCVAGADVAVAWSEVDISAEQQTDVFVADVDPSSSTSSDRIDRNAMDGADTRTVDVVIAGDGDRVVAHFEHSVDASFATNLYVTRYDGSVNAPLGGVIDVDIDSNNLAPPSLVAIAADDVYVAWSAQRTGTASRDIFVAHWDGAAWSELGGGAVRATDNAHFDSASPDLLVIDGVPTLAWAEADDDGWYIFVAELVDDSWQLIGDRLNVDVAREALDPSLAYDTATQTLYVAFEEYVDGAAAVFVKYLAR